MINPAKFIREVRVETNKVTWPTRRETTVSTTMVLVLTAIAALFFLLIDWISGSLIQVFLGM